MTVVMLLVRFSMTVVRCMAVTTGCDLQHEENNGYSTLHFEKTNRKKFHILYSLVQTGVPRKVPLTLTLINWYKIIVFVCVKQAGNLYYVLVHIIILYSFMSVFFMTF
jgi:hypothetical protein